MFGDQAAQGTDALKDAGDIESGDKEGAPVHTPTIPEDEGTHSRRCGTIPGPLCRNQPCNTTGNRSETIDLQPLRDAGGGTRTPDTRIMMGRHRCTVKTENQQ
jgi:hypothetical protein